VVRGACFAILVAGCAGYETQLVLEVCTDYASDEVGRLTVVASDADDPEAMGETRSFAAEDLADGRVSFGVLGLPARRARLEMTLADPAGDVLVTRVVETGFVEGRSVRVSARLTRACADAVCPETCGDGGSCEPVELGVEEWEARGDVCEAELDECDADGDGARSMACGGDDCDDDDGSRFPGNAETCDARDDDCHPCTVGVRDADGDGAIDAACSNPSATECPGLLRDGDLVRGGDCDDRDDAVRPGADEVCNDSDDDCDGLSDEGLRFEEYWPDEDGDGHGDEEATPVEACAQPDGTADDGDDCDDTTAMRAPGVAEACNAIDDDCDGTVDEVADNTFYEDTDGDGFGDESVTMTLGVCEPPEGYARAPGDCVLGDDTIYPGAPELCDGIDQDCSNADDPGGVDPSEDADGDGHAATDASCDGGYPRDDCDDANEWAYEGADEYCSGADEDCDGDVDEETDAQCASGVCDAGCVGDRRIALSDALETGCAVGSDGVYCWGEATASGGGHATVYAEVGERREASPVRVLAGLASEVAFSHRHACARLSSGEVRCWGSNGGGRLGVGTTTPTPGVQTPRGLPADVVQVAAGLAHSCALTAGGDVWCWGENSAGEVGVGDMTPRTTPTQVAIDRVVAIDASSYATCARRYDGEVLCWGAVLGSLVDVPTSFASGASAFRMGLEEMPFNPPEGVICVERDGWECAGYLTSSVGDGMTSATGELVGVSVAEVEEVAPHDDRSCGVSGGEVRCWGEGRAAGLGVASASNRPDGVATRVDDATSVTCGGRLCCAERPAGTTCWGFGAAPVHGDGRPRDGTAPGLAAIDAVDVVALGRSHGLAIRDGEVWVWGDAGTELGTGDRTARFVPDPIGLSAVSVDTSHERTCALDAGGAAFCWGPGRAGDVAETLDSPSPVAVEAGAMGALRSIAVAARVACGLDLAGSAWCWGASTTAYCGDGMGVACPTPVPVDGGRIYDELQAGDRHVCGRAGGEVWCWGSAANGRLGDGSTSGFVGTPQQVLGIDDATALAVGYRTSCVIRAGGAVACWGDGSAGQTGDGSEVDAPTPVAVSGLVDVDALVCFDGCFAHSATRGWVAWGDNEGDWFGVGTVDDSATPVEAAHGMDWDELFVAQNVACGRLGDELRCWGSSGPTGDELLAYPIYSELIIP